MTDFTLTIYSPDGCKKLKCPRTGACENQYQGQLVAPCTGPFPMSAGGKRHRESASARALHFDKALALVRKTLAPCKVLFGSGADVPMMFTPKKLSLVVNNASRLSRSDPKR